MEGIKHFILLQGNLKCRTSGASFKYGKNVEKKNDKKEEK